MPRNLVVAPTAEPIHLAEAKAQCGAYADQTDDDTRISGLIATARAHAEGATWCSLVLRTWEVTMDRFPAEILLQGPVRAVASIQYVDANGATQTMDAADYTVDTKSTVCRVVPAYGLCWPPTRDHVNSVTVRYTAGYAVPFSVNTTADTISAPGHGHANGDVVQLTNSGGALPAGLAPNTNYFVIGATNNTLQLSLTSGGAAVDITGTGTGTHFIGAVPEGIMHAMKLLIDHWYRNRGASGDFPVNEIPFGAERLLLDNAVKRFA